ncbi:MAG: 3-hydroxybenzoate 4-monooxygenase, partial [Leucobacter sp.]|nr:3-hydroxybenzoate 4-monooxygenase [Leucobacter sp.]
MEFHHHGYESDDPRIRPAAGAGKERPAEIPAEVDVLIVGAGPAAMLLAAQLSRFPELTVRIVERRNGRLEIGQADGIQARSVETFQAFGFAERIIAEAYRITETAFWKPDPTNPTHIARATRTPDDANGLSEFPHLVVNQARVLDYFAEAAAHAPGRIVPDWGVEFVDLDIAEEGSHPVTATLRHVAGPQTGSTLTVRAKYVVGGDGARSQVRTSIGRRLQGDSAFHAWGVLDVLANTDFPDVRTKSAIQSHDGGNILLIPREGGHLFRLYVDLGEVAEDNNGAVRATPTDEIIARANAILHPYSVDVKSIAWHSVYEV